MGHRGDRRETRSEWKIMSNPIDSLHDRIQQFKVVANDPEAREDIFEILELLSVLVDEVRRIEDLNIKTRRALNLLSE